MRTKEWLIRTRNKSGLSQKKLSELSGVSAPAIAKIEYGERFGSPETWTKLEAVLSANEPHLSYSSDEEIEDLKADLEEFGPQKRCVCYYDVFDEHIFFTDYMLLEDLEELSTDELKDYIGKKSINVTLVEALDLFEAQDMM